MSCYRIGFIGVGNMASAMIGGMTSVGGVRWEDLRLFDIMSDKTSAFANNGALVCGSIKELYDSSDCVVLSVKPQNFPEILSELSKATLDGRRVLFITIAAGITSDTVSDSLGGGVPVVRALPNTPMLIGKGVSALCKNESVTDEEFELACGFFSASGEVIKIDESDMNRIICVTSSAPAYVFKFIKAICDGAAAQGLDANALKSSVCAMISGAAEMLSKSELSPEQLISMVCSKGGTTERAVAELDRYSFEDGIISAMQKCTDRADELSGINTKK